jgi:hypothetical protein
MGCLKERGVFQLPSAMRLQISEQGDYGGLSLIIDRRVYCHFKPRGIPGATRSRPQSPSTTVA